MKRKLNPDTSAPPLKKKKIFTEPLKTEKISTSQPMFPIFPEASDLDIPGGVAITPNGLQFLPRQGPSEGKKIFICATNVAKIAARPDVVFETIH